MKLAPIRTGSAPVHVSTVYGSPRISFSDQEGVTGILFHGKNHHLSPRSSLHLEIQERKDVRRSSIRRALSETDMIRSVSRVSDRFSSVGRKSFPARIPEEEEEEDLVGSVIVKGLSRDDCGREAGVLVGSDVLESEIEFSGDGIGRGKKIGGGGGGGRSGGGGLSGGSADQSKIGEYYREMLKANPGNPLLLRNYGKFLHEVDKDMARAEECYERAILSCPNDGDVLSLYAKLIWETRGDEERAEAYFDRAVQASPDDW